jgi:hypothetical protein
VPSLVRCLRAQPYLTRLSKGHASAQADKTVPALFIRATSKSYCGRTVNQIAVQQDADVRFPCGINPGAGPAGPEIPAILGLPLVTPRSAPRWIIKQNDLPKSTCFCSKPHIFDTMIRQKPFHTGKLQG